MWAMWPRGLLFLKKILQLLCTVYWKNFDSPLFSRLYRKIKWKSKIIVLNSPYFTVTGWGLGSGGGLKFFAYQTNLHVFTPYTPSPLSCKKGRHTQHAKVWKCWTKYKCTWQRLITYNLIGIKDLLWTTWIQRHSLMQWYLDKYHRWIYYEVLVWGTCNS